MTCSVEGCENKRSARGWCSKHYARWSRTGDPLLVVAPKKYKGKSFDELVDSSGGPDECWPWTGYVNTKDGYGRWRRPGEKNQTVAHRVAYERGQGEVPHGLLIDHACHDPKSCPGGGDCPHRRCCNPAHLKPVTHRENLAAERKSSSVQPGLRSTGQLRLW